MFKITSMLAALIVSIGVTLGAPPAANAQEAEVVSPSSETIRPCTHNVSYEVDGQRGTVILFPTVRCNHSSLELTIESFNPAQTRSVTYRNTSARAYSGYALEFSRTSIPAEYCIVVYSKSRFSPVPDSALNQIENRTTHCVTI